MSPQKLAHPAVLHKLQRQARCLQDENTIAQPQPDCPRKHQHASVGPDELVHYLGCLVSLRDIFNDNRLHVLGRHGLRPEHKYSVSIRRRRSVKANARSDKPRTNSATRPLWKTSVLICRTETCGKGFFTLHDLLTSDLLRSS
ncbi:hypothetical protein Plhal304r1_c003g0009591 [Plasmopara halstedii]